MKNRRHFFLLFLIATICCSSGVQEDVIAKLKANDQNIKKIVGTDKSNFTKEQKDKIKKVFDNFFNFEKMSGEVLKDHWARLTSKQRQEFVVAFSTLLKESSLRDLSLYQSKLVYKKVQVVDGVTEARLHAIKDSKRVKLVYRMIYSNQNGWKIFDFLLDGVSTAESYKTSFDRIIREKSFDVLMSKINKKISVLRNKV